MGNVVGVGVSVGVYVDVGVGVGVACTSQEPQSERNIPTSRLTSGFLMRGIPLQESRSSSFEMYLDGLSYPNLSLKLFCTLMKKIKDSPAEMKTAQCSLPSFGSKATTLLGEIETNSIMPNIMRRENLGNWQRVANLRRSARSSGLMSRSTSSRLRRTRAKTMDREIASSDGLKTATDRESHPKPLARLPMPKGKRGMPTWTTSHALVVRGMTAEMCS
jgi:hypothetical protein